MHRRESRHRFNPVLDHGLDVESLRVLQVIQGFGPGHSVTLASRQFDHTGDVAWRAVRTLLPGHILLVWKSQIVVNVLHRCVSEVKILRADQFGRRGLGNRKSVVPEFFDVEFDCFADEGGGFLTSVRGGDTAGEVQDVDSVAGGSLFDDDGVFHQVFSPRAACFGMLRWRSHATRFIPGYGHPEEGSACWSQCGGCRPASVAVGWSGAARSSRSRPVASSDTVPASLDTASCFRSSWSVSA